jgi:phage baseplate assembly protein W
MGYTYVNVRENFDKNNDISFGPGFAEDPAYVFMDITTTPGAIKSKLKLLLLTRKGERYMLPQFGSNLMNILFEPADINYMQDAITNTILDAVQRWLPDVGIENIKIKTEDTDPGLNNIVDVSFEYSIDGYEPFTFELWYDQKTGKMKTN